MEPFAGILTAGGRSNSLGRAGEVVNAVLADPRRLDELWACIGHDDAYVRMRAIDSFEKVVSVHPGWADPYVDRLLGELTLSTQPSIQWHLAQLFAQVDLDDVQRGRAIAWLTGRLATTEVDWIVSVDCMRALLAFHARLHVGAAVLRELFETQTGHRSKTVRRKAGEFLAELPVGADTDHGPVTFDRCDHVVGPFFHGTTANLEVGDELVAGHPSNYHDGRTSRHVYISSLLEPAVWGAELAAALTGTERRGRIYVVEPTGPFEDDPNVTDKRFPGNVTRSFRTRHPVRVVGEVTGWEGHPPEVLQGMLDHLAALRAQGLDLIED